MRGAKFFCRESHGADSPSLTLGWIGVVNKGTKHEHMHPSTHLSPRLRQTLLQGGHGMDAPVRAPFSTGAYALDRLLGRGLARGALHEIYALSSADSATAAGFATALAIRAAEGRPILWARQDYADVEAGGLYGPGLAELGLDPGRLILIQARDVVGVLRAGAEGARCGALGAVVIEPWGESKALDLTASRRLVLAAGESGVTLLMVRADATPRPSAAASRWGVRPRLSRALEGGAPGWPAFTLTLLRHRAGLPQQTFDVEWDRDRTVFADLAPLSGPLAAAPARGTLGEAEPALRQAG